MQRERPAGPPPHLDARRAPLDEIRELAFSDALQTLVHLGKVLECKASAVARSHVHNKRA